MLWLGIILWYVAETKYNSKTKLIVTSNLWVWKKNTYPCFFLTFCVCGGVCVLGRLIIEC